MVRSFSPPSMDISIQAEVADSDLSLVWNVRGHLTGLRLEPPQTFAWIENIFLGNLKSHLTRIRTFVIYNI